MGIFLKFFIRLSLRRYQTNKRRPLGSKPRLFVLIRKSRVYIPMVLLRVYTFKVTMDRWGDNPLRTTDPAIWVINYKINKYIKALSLIKEHTYNFLENWLRKPYVATVTIRYAFHLIVLETLPGCLTRYRRSQYVCHDPITSLKVYYWIHVVE